MGNIEEWLSKRHKLSEDDKIYFKNCLLKLQRRQIEVSGMYRKEGKR